MRVRPPRHSGAGAGALGDDRWVYKVWGKGKVGVRTRVRFRALWRVPRHRGAGAGALGDDRCEGGVLERALRV